MSVFVTFVLLKEFGILSDQYNRHFHTIICQLIPDHTAETLKLAYFW